MRVKFCRFSDSNGLEVIVNPLAIRHLTPGPPGTTRICFDNTHSVSVRGSPRQVQDTLTSDLELHTFAEP